jgi:carboxyl-terminal processing protease
MLLLLLSSNLVILLKAAEPVATPAAAVSQETTNKGYHVSPGPADGQIASLTARMLQQLHYLHQPFDETISSKFLDRYLESLDPQHVHFTQADLQEFDHYRTNLNHLTLNRHNVADTHPADEIFERFVQRLQQRVAYVDELLKTEKFTFDTDERVTLNRHELPYPKDLDEAKTLWRDRLRFEYLQEKLAKIDAHKKAQSTKKTETTQPANSSSPETAPKSDAEEIVATLSHRYHRNLRTFTDYNNDDVLQIYLTALAHVYDPHSDYFGHAQLESFSIGMNLSLFGIGAELISEDGYCTILRLLPRGPAIESKQLKEKDRIIGVAQGADQPFVDVVDMNLNKAVQLIRGPKGTEVRLKVLPPGSDAATPSIVSLVRREITLDDQAAKAKIIELPGGSAGPLRMGVIDLPSFYAPFDLGSNKRTEHNSKDGAAPSTTSVDVALLLKKLKEENVSGVILDLRRNGGGSLDEAIKLTGLFIKEGPVVQVVNSDGRKEVQEDNDASVAYDGPLIVLTSKFSASASEIVAGALQDYGRALVVGDASTHGKGTVQSVNPLGMMMRMPPTNDPGALKLTIKKFYRASGGSTQEKGVEPDIVLPSVFNDAKDVGEKSLENALKWDTTDPAKFERMNLVAPYLPELKKHSTERVAAEREYDYVREDIEQFKKMQADKTFSLNENKRLKEKEEAEARQKARDKERLARKEPPEKVYELSLKQCSLPGLPPPVEKTNLLAKATGRSGSTSAGKGVGVKSGAGGGGEVASAATGTELTINDNAEEEKPPAPDASLTEAEHILVDYIALLAKGNVLAAGQPPVELNRKD